MYVQLMFLWRTIRLPKSTNKRNYGGWLSEQGAYRWALVSRVPHSHLQKIVSCITVEHDDECLHPPADGGIEHAWGEVRRRQGTMACLHPPGDGAALDPASDELLHRAFMMHSSIPPAERTGGISARGKRHAGMAGITVAATDRATRVIEGLMARSEQAFGASRAGRIATVCRVECTATGRQTE